LHDADPTTGPDRLAELPRVPRDEHGPVFAEPWQAQAFALAVTLALHLEGVERGTGGSTPGGSQTWRAG
jgi:hypothetical protein